MVWKVEVMSSILVWGNENCLNSNVCKICEQCSLEKFIFNIGQKLTTLNFGIDVPKALIPVVHLISSAVYNKTDNGTSFNSAVLKTPLTQYVLVCVVTTDGH